jgi:acetyl esterase/lipase
LNSPEISPQMRQYLSGTANQRTQKSKLDMSVADERANLDAFMSRLPIPEKVVFEDLTLGGRPARKVLPNDLAADGAVLFFHGGGYRVGSLDGYKSFMAYLALACGVPVYGLDYRLSPEHTYPAALNDAVSAFVELSQSVEPERIMWVGDSAGGGLALASLLTLKEKGLALGGAAALLSAWLDGTASGDSYGARRAEFCTGMRGYAGDYPLDTVGVSPLFGDHEGLPPLLLQVVESEPMRDDSTQLQQRASAAGVDSRIEVFAYGFHDFQIFTDIPEARAAIDSIGSFFSEVVA